MRHHHPDALRGCLRSRSERGAVAIEAAFALPIMVLLGIGILTYGQAYSDASITSGSTRTGARLASATYAPATDKDAAAASVLAAIQADLGNLKSATPVEVWMYKADGATGLPPSGNFTSCSGACMKWRWSAATSAFLARQGSWSQPNGCGAQTDYVGVYIKATLNLNTGLFGARTITVNQKTIMRLEPIITTLCV